MGLPEQPGQVIFDSLSLERCLGRGALSQLWVARDVHLAVTFMVRVYPAIDELHVDVREAIHATARHYKSLSHDAIARVIDLRASDRLLCLLIEHHERGLLADALSSEPLPYREVIAGIRPVAQALLHVHAAGAEHGRVGADHLVLGPNGAWVLLPPDVSTAARPDVGQIGHLMAELLTAGRVPRRQRSLNDATELLYAGRTIPALLDDLIGDLLSSGERTSATSLPEVIDRLDQVSRIAVSRDDPPAPTATPHGGDASEKNGAPTFKLDLVARSATSNRILRRSVLLSSIVVILLLGASVVARSVWIRLSAGNEPPLDAVTGVVAPGVPDDSAEHLDVAGDIVRARAGADESLAQYLDARADAEALGAPVWADSAYAESAGAAAEADQAYLAERYEDATSGYDRASAAIQAIIRSKDDVFQQLLADGAQALADGSADGATNAYQLALLIDPASEAARVGAARAQTIEELVAMLDSGERHERSGRLAFALADYTSASELDPHAQRAESARERVRGLILDSEFRAAMGSGLGAFHGGDLETALDALVDARRLRPDDPAPMDALSLVGEARIRREVSRLRELAGDAERDEHWQDARKAYVRVLAIDPVIEFAQSGKRRTEHMIEMHQHANRYISDPELLMHAENREHAASVINEIENSPEPGPILHAARATLAEILRLATTPRRVVLRSDNRTKVDIYRVGQYKAFESIELELLPGEYTVVGHRVGYRDVRLTLRVAMGEGPVDLRVVCTEAI